MKYFNKILSSGKTIFRYQDLEILLWVSNRNTLKSFFQRGVDEGVFVLVQKGIYSLKKYDLFELATKLKKNSYISFETVLKDKWIIFQDYGNTLFLASNNTLEKKISNISYKYLKLKNDILLNPIGIEQKDNYMIASVERAICRSL